MPKDGEPLLGSFSCQTLPAASQILKHFLNGYIFLQKREKLTLSEPNLHPHDCTQLEHRSVISLPNPRFPSAPLPKLQAYPPSSPLSSTPISLFKSSSFRRALHSNGELETRNHLRMDTAILSEAQRIREKSSERPQYKEPRDCASNGAHKRENER